MSWSNRPLVVALCGLLCCLPFASARAELVARWQLDGDLLDSSPTSSHPGEFAEGLDPSFTEGPDGSASGALALDGVGFVDVANGVALPIQRGPRHSIAFWVRAEPHAEGIVYGEGASGGGLATFSIGTPPGESTGELAVFLSDDAGEPLLSHVRSTTPVFDGAWHLVAWVDNDGEAELWIDGVRDTTDFSYSRRPLTVDHVTLGALTRGPTCCFLVGAIADVRVWDHPLSALEVEALDAPAPGCPAVGDTLCGALELVPPADGPTAPGVWTARVLDASDDSGDAIRHLFEARSAAGEIVRAGPTDESSAALVLDAGTWTVRALVDDDPECDDTLPAALCESPPFEVGCPVEGDTHCGRLVVRGPGDGGPGLWEIQVVDSIDESGDPILYTLSGRSASGRELHRGPQSDNTFRLELREGPWSFEVRVDDDTDCDDEAPDAVCSTELGGGCPPEGDTHCGDLLIETLGGTIPGRYTARVFAAGDDSGDEILYRFEAIRGDGATLSSELTSSDEWSVALTAGEWTLRTRVDDDTECSDEADDAVCVESFDIDPAPAREISRWRLDGNVDDSNVASDNDGFFSSIEGDAPLFDEGHDGAVEGALVFRGEEHVEVTQNRLLPAFSHESYTVALWVRGDASDNGRVWSEASSGESQALFTLGADDLGTGRVSVRLRNGRGQTILDDVRSERIAFDGEWHHIAWVDDGGEAALWVDGVRDPTDFSYRRPLESLDRTAIGAELTREPGRWFRGLIDDVRVWSHALSAADIADLVPEPTDCPTTGDTRCGELLVEGPDDGGAGPWRLSSLGASDESGDPLLYTFTATRDDGRVEQSGPDSASEAILELTSGVWTLAVVVDDDLLCRDELAEARCSVEVTIGSAPRVLLSEWTFGGSLRDTGIGDNDGVFVGEPIPPFGPDREGRQNGALVFDGNDDRLEIAHESGLPAAALEEYTIALWVRGPPQDTAAVWSESSRLEDGPLLRIGPWSRAGSGHVEVLMTDDDGVAVIPNLVSEGIAFDGEWHHIAWVEDGGEAALWIDGRLDATSFRHDPVLLSADRTTIGGVSSPEACCSFEGSIDEVRVYTWALDGEEIRELIGAAPPPAFRRGDANDDGAVDLTDAVFVLNYLFTGGAAPGCEEAADADDGGSLELTDAVLVLNFLFLGAGPPAAPGPFECGVDGEGSPALPCAEHRSCGGV